MGAADPRLRRRFLAALAAACAVMLGLVPSPAGASTAVAPTAAAAKAAAAKAADPVGGPLLGSRGVVVHLGKGAPRLPKGLTARAFVVADLDSGEILAARDPHGRYLPASTLKLLTARALIPKLDPKKRVRPSFAAVNIEGSKVGLVQQHTYPVATLFTAMLISSGNDAANTLAETAGGYRATTALMNAAAVNLQAKDTFARNPHGLDAPRQRSSAYDLALIGRAALQLQDFRKYTMVRKTYLPKKGKGRFEIHNRNKLLLNNYPGVIGGKSGYTVAAGHTFVGFAQRGERRLVVTIMKAKLSYYSTDLVPLLDWGFKAAGKVQPVGHLVPPLDEIRPAALPQAAPAAAPGSNAGARLQAAADSSSDSGLLGLDLHLRWWHLAVPLAVVTIAVLLLGARRRRRRRRGFYMPQTKLRLPVR
jgi:D-alanyl-D-alanine carboxypeptidase (penicillin-binding protein 5/6)